MLLIITSDWYLIAFRNTRLFATTTPGRPCIHVLGAIGAISLCQKHHINAKTLLDHTSRVVFHINNLIKYKFVLPSNPIGPNCKRSSTITQQTSTMKLSLMIAAVSTATASAEWNFLNALTRSKPRGSSFCTWAPDNDCFESGWPQCCDEDLDQPCPKAQPRCDTAAPGITGCKSVQLFLLCLSITI